MKVAFVVPRYGPAVIGGAETAARMFAEHLAVLAGWDVEVLTTCAEDFVTWGDVYPPGEESIGGVCVRRFVSQSGRQPSFHPLSASLLANPANASLADAELWLDLQGPVNPELAEAAITTDADVAVFYPYLYYPTARVIGRMRVPTVLHPAAHDEPALRLPIFPPVFAAADGLVFQTVAERELVQQTFPVASQRQLLLGLGVDDPIEDAVVRGTDESSPPEEAYLLCLGRIDRHKGTLTLAAMFAAYKERHPGPLRLVLAGPVVHRPDPHPDIDVVGPVSEGAKWELLRSALALVSPSGWEAFSLVIAEAWTARTPVMVNASCGPTVEHALRSGGGIPFGGYGGFEVAVERLCRDPELANTLGERGRSYVDTHFRWPIVIDRYAGFLQSVAEGGSRSAGTG